MTAEHRPFIHPRTGPLHETRAHRWWASYEIGAIRDDESAFGFEVGRRVVMHARMFGGWCSGFRYQLELAVQRQAAAVEGRLFA